MRKGTFCIMLKLYIGKMDHLLNDALVNFHAQLIV